MDQKLPCVVLLDLMMPVMSGWSVVSAMRADPRLRSIPICVITAVAKQAPAEAECVLEKPVAVPELLQAVGSYC
jgi:CheY-like chemotaxis protein